MQDMHIYVIGMGSGWKKQTCSVYDISGNIAEIFPKPYVFNANAESSLTEFLQRRCAELTGI